MSIILSESFELNKYGIHCRLVNESDSGFIVRLRADEKRGRYIHHTDQDIDKQILWIRDYKEREARGEEYYFIYDINGVPFGVNRIYSIEDNHCTEGSWVCLPIEDSSKVIASSLIIRDIIFESLGFDYDVFDVRLDNKKVRTFHRISGAKLIGKTEIDALYKLSKEDYFINREWFIKTYGL